MKFPIIRDQSIRNAELRLLLERKGQAKGIFAQKAHPGDVKEKPKSVVTGRITKDIIAHETLPAPPKDVKDRMSRKTMILRNEENFRLLADSLGPKTALQIITRLGGNEKAKKAFALAGQEGLKIALSYRVHIPERVVLASNIALRLARDFGDDPKRIESAVNSVEDHTGIDGWKALIENWYWIDRRIAEVAHPMEIGSFGQMVNEVIEKQKSARRAMWRGSN